jgi:transcription antitermination protein NusB
MTRRSRAREVALQLLFQRDHNPGVDRPALERFVADRLLRAEVLRPLCLGLYDGVVAHLEEIDKRLTASADNWRLVRMATVDRNVLRLGAYELLFGQETPAAVAFDEAIELARRYGSAESAAFVNGVLDRLRREALATPAPATEEANVPAAEATQNPPVDSAGSPPT